MTANELKVAIAELKVVASRLDSGVKTCADWLDILDREVSDATDLRSEFYTWMVDVAGKSPKTAKDTSRVYVPSISDALQSPTIHIWHGLREALYGERATKTVYDLRSVAELQQYYSGIGKVLGKAFDSSGFDTNRYKKCWDWAHNPMNHNSISAGWSLFCRFMEWRDSDRMRGVLDKLAIAIREFKAHRQDSDWMTEDSTVDAYYAVNSGIREYYGKLDEAKVRAFGKTEITELFTGVKDENGKKIFEPMWSGKVGMGWPHIQKAFADDPKKVTDFLGDLIASDKALHEFAKPESMRPGGFGGSVVSELLMKFHPDTGFKYGEKTANVIKFLGLADYKPHPTNFKQDEYDHVLDIATKIKQALADAGVSRCIDDELYPDFITTNEFLDWVHEHQILLEEVFSKEKPASDSLSITGDRLSVALKLFAAARDEGSPAAGEVRYWTYSPGKQASAWDEVRNAGVIALSYREVGDYSKLGDKDAIVEAFQMAAGDDASHKNSARAVIDFRDVMKPGDIVFAKKGVSQFIGVGRVLGEFYYDGSADGYKNRRKVDWFKVENFDFEGGKAAQKSLTDITEFADVVQKLCKAYGVDPIECGISNGGPNGWASYDAWAKAARETFAKVDAGMLVAADFDYADFARKFVYNPTVANVFFKDHEEDEKSEVGNFISQNRQTPKAASWYLEKDNLPKVKGLGVGCALNFMMKVRPAEFATYSPMIDKALMSVGLLAKPMPTDPTVESYEQCKALQGRVLAKMHELKVGKAADDDSPADYLTVNEFAWWLSDETNQNLIKEKVMSAQLKPVDSKKTVIKGNRALSDAFKDDEMLKRLAAALRTKPFAILAGHSGTGKSQLVRRLAYMTCNNQKLVDEGKDKTAPGNYCMVQVKPNWHDSTDLLGYYSDLGTRHFVNTAFVQFLCKAYAYPETPFFLCLDEMNLAPVEQYFAEYLSAVESLEKKGGDWVSDSLIEIVKTGEKDENGNAKVDEEILGQIIAGAQSTEAADWIRKHGLTIPKNLFVVGTVNMDETTCQFSRKVLDRAMTLLMNEVKFAEMCKAVDPSKEQLLDDAGVAFFMQGSRRGHVDTVEAGLLDNLNKPLANTPFVVAYRFANEYALYEEALANLNGVPQLDEGEADEAKIAEHWKKVSEHAVDALDHVVLMKLLPRIHGMKDVVKGIFEGRKIAEKDTPGLKDVVKADGLSAGIMTEILNRGDEYLTFWP